MDDRMKVDEDILIATFNKKVSGILINLPGPIPYKAKLAAVKHNGQSLHNFTPEECADELCIEAVRQSSKVIKNTHRAFIHFLNRKDDIDFRLELIKANSKVLDTNPGYFT